MICTKCGKDTFVKSGDWYTCLNCGAVIFDTNVSIGDSISPTREIQQREAEQIKGGNKPADEAFAQAEKSVEKSGQEPKRVKNTKKAEKTKKTKNKRSETIEFFTPVLIAFALAMILRTFVFANAQVPTGSMLNTIQQGDRIIASRLSYVIDKPERYDIVIFEYPDWEIDDAYDKKTYFVKRIIGLPGETVEVKAGIVYVTTPEGETIQLDDSFVTNGTPKGSYGPYTVPEGCYFMMGDNRNNSWDARFWESKYVSEDKILGKVKFRYYPSISKIE